MLPLFVTALALAIGSRAVDIALPTVNLGYTQHRAIAYNATGGYYNFSSIRYAEPPLGKLRFALPVPVNGQSDAVSNGSEGRRCPQSLACWYAVQSQFVAANSSGQPFDFDAAYQQVYRDGACDSISNKSSPDPMASEDCLFLDVIVPETVYDASNRRARGAPVLVYFQDGGFVSGWKEQYTPAGLIRQSLKDGDSGVIYVGFNYRLGAFGWLSGSSYQADGGLVNAALHDQRLVLNWIQRNIGLFGGDPSRVTVMGESAGGSSIMMQLTAYRNSEAPPFHQIIVQSPAAEPASKTPSNQDQTYNRFLQLTGVNDLAGTRNKSTEDLMAANDVLVKSQPYGSSAIGPADDGMFVSASYKTLMQEYVNRYNVSSLTTYSSNEAGLVAPANITTEEGFAKYVELLMAASDNETRSYVRRNVFPAIYNGSYPYTTLWERAKLFWSELITTCNNNLIHNATGIGWATEYAVSPAVHLSDTSSIFWNGPGSDSSVDENVASSLQGYIINYVLRGDPNRGFANRTLPTIPRWGTGQVLALNKTGSSVKGDMTVNKRCTYLNTAPWGFS